MTIPDTWGPYFFLSITDDAGTERQIAPLVDLSTLEISEGDFPGEGLPNAAGGRNWKQSPQEDGEVSFEVFARELEKTQGLFQLFYGSSAAAEPLTTGTAITASVLKIRGKFMVAVLFTNDPNATLAAGGTETATDALRFVARDCRLIAHKPTMTDGILKVPVTFKYPAANRGGTARLAEWTSGDQTAIGTAHLI